MAAKKESKESKESKEPIQWHDFVAWLFFAMLSYFAYDMNSTMKEMNHSVVDLNKNVAVMLYQGTNHEERLKEIEKYIFKRNEQTVGN